MLTLLLLIGLAIALYVGFLLFLVKLGFAALKLLLSGGIGMVILIIVNLLTRAKSSDVERY